MELVIDVGPEPVSLALIQHRRHRVRDVDDAAGVAGHDEQEAVGRLQDQVLQLLVRQEGRLVGAVSRGVTGAWGGTGLDWASAPGPSAVVLPVPAEGRG